MPRGVKKKVELEAVTDETEPFFVNDEPAAEPVTAEYDVDSPVTLIPIIAEAWDASKGAGDAAFNDCQPAFKEILLAHATAVLKTSAVLGGDSAIAKFEREISKHIK